MPHDTLNIQFNLDLILFVLIGGPAMLFCAWKIYRDMTASPRRWIWAYALGLAILMLLFLASLEASFHLPGILLALYGYIMMMCMVPIFFFMLCFCGLHILRSLAVKPHHFPLLFGCVFAGLLYLGFDGFKWDRNWIPPQRMPIEMVQNGKKTYPLTDAWVIEVPDRVLKRLSLYPKDAGYLTGTKKHVVVQKIPCEWSELFTKQVNELIGSTAFNKIYDLTILPPKAECDTSCHGKDCENWKKEMKDFDGVDCPSFWTGRYCGNGVCIINPQTKEMIADYSQDINQLPLLLEAYAAWDKEPLLGENK